MAPVRSRRDDILAAARAEFGSAGYFGARIERIVAAARVNKQLVFHYFGSKEGLFAAALAGMLAEPVLGDAAASPPEQLRAIVGALENLGRRRPGLVAIAADARANAGFPRGAARLVRAWIDQLASRLEQVLADGQRRGYFRDEVDPAAVAALAVSGALGSAILGPGAREPSLSRLVLDHCVWR